MLGVRSIRYSLMTPAMSEGVTVGSWAGMRCVRLRSRAWVGAVRLLRTVASIRRGHTYVIASGSVRGSIAVVITVEWSVGVVLSLMMNSAIWVNISALMVLIWRTICVVTIS